MFAARKGSMTELNAIMGKPGKIRTAKEIGGTESAGSEVLPQAIGRCFNPHSLRDGCGNCRCRSFSRAPPRSMPKLEQINMTISWARSKPEELRAHHARDAAEMAGALPDGVAESELAPEGSFRGGLLFTPRDCVADAVVIYFHGG